MAKSKSLALVAAVIVLIGAFVLSRYIMSSRSNAATSPAEIEGADGLLTAKALSDAQVYLHAAVPCAEKRVFFNGNDQKTGDSFWSLQCTDGTGYLVELEPDVEGSTTVTACSTLGATADVKCFEKVK
jgi:hypothetical protein